MRTIKNYANGKGFKYDEVNGLGGYREVSVTTSNQTYLVDYFEETKEYTLYYTFFTGKKREIAFKTQKEVTLEINKNEHLTNFNNSK
ncbi:hypothetical protein LMHOCYYV_CDS0010 [Staphylococcus phage PG-2021_4]